MECTLCKPKSCRKLEPCGNEAFSREELVEAYKAPETLATMRAASRLVDGGRAGTLSRLEEIAEFALDRSWKRIGFAYCRSMEKDATLVSRYLRSKGLRVEAVSCSTGAIAQDDIDEDSTTHKVSCNPLGQARQIKAFGADLVVDMGLCVGHDILFRQATSDLPGTTLAVKDRTSGHAPLESIRRIGSQETAVPSP
ncbi:MAG TPA: DUF1847 domain-containing protein [Fibrobacteria bacterium]|nr:DUF1847 domain-containing protein [Fibrobacteria bacterium]